jgi:hypothetical protein
MDKYETIVRDGEFQYSLRDEKGVVLVEVQIEDVEDENTLTEQNIKNALINETQVHIEQIDEDDEHYFSDCSDAEKDYIKTTFLSILKRTKEELTASSGKFGEMFNNPLDLEKVISKRFADTVMYILNNQPDFVKEYDRLNGTNISKKLSPIENMIDAVSGNRDSELRNFFDVVRITVFEPALAEEIADISK